MGLIIFYNILNENYSHYNNIIASIVKDYLNLNWFKKNYLVNFILLKCLADFKKTLLKLR